MNDKERLALAAWIAAVDAWVEEATDKIEKLESQVSSLEGTAKGQKELVTSLGERVAALEQINNKSKQDTGPKADPGGPGFYYCSSCATRQLIGSVHYCVPAKLYGGFKYEGKEVKPGAYEGVYQSVNISATPVKENFFYGHYKNQEGDGHVVLPRSAAPTPPAGGQTEKEIRRAAHPEWFASGFTVKGLSDGPCQCPDCY